MLKRTSILSVLLAASIIFAASSAYRLWENGPWDLPKPGKAKAPVAGDEPEAEESRPPQVANTRTIVDRNLFDPERGQNRTKSDEVSSAAMQRVRSLVLLGTALLGSSRYAIIEDPTKAAGPAKAQPGNPGQMRFSQGDSWEGFRLSEVRERSVVFTRGPSRVELALDYSRSGAPLGPRASVVPAVAPRAAAPQPEPTVAPEPQAPARDAIKDRAARIEAERAARAERDKAAARVEKERRPARQQRQLQPPQQAAKPPERAPSIQESAPAESSD